MCYFWDFFSTRFSNSQAPNDPQNKSGEYRPGKLTHYGNNNLVNSLGWLGTRIRIYCNLTVEKRIFGVHQYFQARDSWQVQHFSMYIFSAIRVPTANQEIARGGGDQ